MKTSKKWILFSSFMIVLGVFTAALLRVTGGTDEKEEI